MIVYYLLGAYMRVFSATVLENINIASMHLHRIISTQTLGSQKYHMQSLVFWLIVNT
jgi:hypothetical protein